MLGVLMLACLVGGSIDDPLGEVEWLKTKHYDLVLAMDPARQEDTALLVEAAWNAYKKELGAKPKSKAGKRARIYFYRSKADWNAGMEHEQEFPLPGVAFVHYSPKRNTLYLHDEFNRYHARKMLLYGLFLQFHYRIKAKNEYLGKEWFITGMADALSTHRWDGKSLELGARLHLGSENRARLAISRGLLEKLQDGQLSVEDMSDWDVRWALSAFLIFGENGAYRKTFQKRALGSSGSMLLGHDFMSGIGDVKEITGQLDAWVREEAITLAPVLGNWTEEGPRVVGDVSGSQVVAVAVCDPEARSIETTVTSHPSIEVGLLIDRVDREHFTMAVISDDILRVWQYEGPRDHELMVKELPNPSRKPHQLRARVEGDEVVLFVGKREVRRFPSKGKLLGLASRGGKGVFHDVSFE